MKKHFALLILLMVSLATTCLARQADHRKMSALVRTLAMEQDQLYSRLKAPAKTPVDRREVCAFVQCSGDGEETLRQAGCRVLANEGDIYIASIPLRRLNTLSLLPQVTRIEAGRGTQALLDSATLQVNADKVWAGTASLPQAYDGTGVVVGVQDIGFDLTHPNFYSRGMIIYRIRRLWDMLSKDTLQSALYVGRDYTSEDELLSLGHSADGLIAGHGTHTTGIVAGSGYDSGYRGVAPGADLCLVANAVGSNAHLIDSIQLYKYTYALDALGFKYITDYARQLGKPSVISFSEGSPEDFRGDDKLYYSFLERLVSPGHIIVASAGNAGRTKGYFHKPVGRLSAGSLVATGSKSAYFAVKCNQDFTLRMVAYPSGTKPDTLLIHSRDVLSAPDSTITDSLQLGTRPFTILTTAYQNVWDTTQTVYEYTMVSNTKIGVGEGLSLEVVGEDADAEFFNPSFDFVSSSAYAHLDAGEQGYTMYSPSSAPCVISVGATAYRSTFLNWKGEQMTNNWGSNGALAAYSSRGPTYYGATKPDVVAPGTNVFSSFNSFYYEAHSDVSDFNYMVKTSTYGGRTYPWVAETGTSMATPMAAGCIALWLQAKPDLTVDEIRQVFAKTCVQPRSDLTYPNNLYGYGQIDAYRGLLEILGLTGIHGLSQQQPAALHIGLNAAGDLVLSSRQTTTAPLRVSVYSAAGALLLSRQLPAGQQTYSLPLTGMQKGVYAVQVSSREKAMTGSSLIRK